MNMKLLFSVVVTLIGTALSLAACAQGANSELPIVQLVVGTPTSVVAIESLSNGPAEPDIIQIGDVYRVSFDSVRTIVGSVEIRRGVVVDLVATHRSSIPEGDVYMLLEFRGDEDPRLLHWGVPISIACIPGDDVVSRELELAFMAYRRFDGAVCTTLGTP